MSNTLNLSISKEQAEWLINTFMFYEKESNNILDDAFINVAELDNELDKYLVDAAKRVTTQMMGEYNKHLTPIKEQLVDFIKSFEKKDVYTLPLTPEEAKHITNTLHVYMVYVTGAVDLKRRIEIEGMIKQLYDQLPQVELYGHPTINVTLQHLGLIQDSIDAYRHTIHNFNDGDGRFGSVSDVSSSISIKINHIIYGDDGFKGLDIDSDTEG